MPLGPCGPAGMVPVDEEARPVVLVLEDEPLVRMLAADVRVWALGAFPQKYARVLTWRQFRLPIKRACARSRVCRPDPCREVSAAGCDDSDVWPVERVRKLANAPPPPNVKAASVRQTRASPMCAGSA